MDRRTFLVAGACGGAAIGTSASAFQTDFFGQPSWIVRTSEGFDALGFLSPLSGDPFYADHYRDEVRSFAPRLDPSTIADIKALKAEVDTSDGLMSPSFYLYFSGGRDAVVEDLFASMDNPEALLRPKLEASPYWDAAQWQRFVGRLPRLRLILQALFAAGFRSFRNALIAPQASSKLPALREKLANYDVLKWASFYTGRPFGPSIEVTLMHFNKPHGIKIIGQRFLSGLDYSDEITIQNAAHEVLHPPVPLDGGPAKRALLILKQNPLLGAILADRNKSYGYGSVRGLFDEGLVKALDQIISERLGVAVNPRSRWRSQDGGMHILAAAFYELMKSDGFARTGGNLEHWLDRQAAAGNLAPKALHSAAGKVLGYPADRIWPPPK